MRKVFLLLAALGLTGTLWAADPIIGTWKLNVAKSKFPSPQLAPKEQTEVYRETGDGQIELIYRSSKEDGSSNLEVIVFPATGGAAGILKGAIAGRSYIETMITPIEWIATGLENGKQIFILHKVISKNGKTMTQTSRSIEQGVPNEYILIYEKQ